MTHLFFLPSYAFLAGLHPTRKVITKRRRNGANREPTGTCFCLLLGLFERSLQFTVVNFLPVLIILRSFLNPRIAF